MSGVTATLSASVVAALAGTADFGVPYAPVKVERTVSIAPGTATLDQADVLWADQRTLAASATENLDLAGTLAGLLGGTVTGAEITAIYLEADAGNTNDVVFFGAASNGFNGPLSGTTPKLTLGPGDVALITNRKGWTVTAATGDIMLVANAAGGTAVTYKAVVIGRTVAV
jgi:hypothetical protein